jgi:hypothetical protein
MIVEETALQIGTAYYVRVAAQSLGGLVIRRGLWFMYQNVYRPNWYGLR